MPAHQDPARPQTLTHSGSRCARGDHCPNAAPEDDGTLTAAWAEDGAPFCRRCLAAVIRALDAMPYRYVQLRTRLGDKTKAGLDGGRVSGSREAPILLRLDVDALIRDMLHVLCSWEDEVAAAERLHRPWTRLSRYRRDEYALPVAVQTLQPRILTLLGLPPRPMVRYVPLAALPQLPASALAWAVRNDGGGYATVNLDLAGADAGREILHLAYLSRRLLGETTPPAIGLDGIPCKRCEALALEAAPEPDYKSSCVACGDLLTEAEYKQWTAQYAAWAEQRVVSGDLEPAWPEQYARDRGVKPGAIPVCDAAQT